MSKKVINSPEGFRIKEFDAKGGSKGVSVEVFATEEEAAASIKPKRKKAVSKKKA
jgi:hypothetical protein